MNNRVDNFFKTKLNEHQLPPSAKGWEKIDANLSKKNKTILWFQLAAAVALIGILTFAILQWMVKADQQPQLANEKNKSAAPKTIQPEKEIIQPQRSLVDATNKPSVASTSDFKKQNEKQKEEKETTLQEKETTLQEKELTLISQTKEEATTEEETLEKAEAVITEKPITLVFNLPTLKPKNGLTAEDATGEEKKTALQKVVDTANDLRTGDVLGDLREAKDELFALEFRKDKSKKQE